MRLITLLILTACVAVLKAENRQTRYYNLAEDSEFEEAVKKAKSDNKLLVILLGGEQEIFAELGKYAKDRTVLLYLSPQNLDYSTLSSLHPLVFTMLFKKFEDDLDARRPPRFTPDFLPKVLICDSGLNGVFSVISDNPFTNLRSVNDDGLPQARPQMSEIIPKAVRENVLKFHGKDHRLNNYKPWLWVIDDDVIISEGDAPNNDMRSKISPLEEWELTSITEEQIHLTSAHVDWGRNLTGNKKKVLPIKDLKFGTRWLIERTLEGREQAFIKNYPDVEWQDVDGRRLKAAFRSFENGILQVFDNAKKKNYEIPEARLSQESFAEIAKIQHELKEAMYDERVDE